MLEITAENAAEYLTSRGRVAAGEEVVVQALSGGVSNVVLRVTLPARGQSFVLKQARGRLNVRAEWHASLERVWREIDVLRLCGELLTARGLDRNTGSGGGAVAGSIIARFEFCVPRVLWEDRDNYLFAMTAAPPGHWTWKEMLLAGQTRMAMGMAVACGQLLGTLHGASWKNADIARRLDDRTFFDQLRIDPYYRHVAARRGELAPHLQRLSDSVWQHRLCLVHGDFSPKNLLVWGGQAMLIDFEVGHYGDGAFDLGFFLTHLVLKSLWAGPRGGEYLGLANVFWSTYRSVLSRDVPEDELAALEERAMFNLAGCMLARVEGKSPVDYLSPQQQDWVREISAEWLVQPPATWQAAVEGLGARASSYRVP